LEGKNFSVIIVSIKKSQIIPFYVLDGYMNFPKVNKKCSRYAFLNNSPYNFNVPDKILY